MKSGLRGEDTFFRVKEYLNKEKIKLWLQPYYDETNKKVGNEQEQALQVLCEKIKEQLNIDEDQCISVLRDLQNVAFDHLKSNQVFKDTGVACLKVKVSGDLPRVIAVNILLSASASQLVEEVSTGVGISSERLKLISHGRVLKASESLASQGVKNGMHLMAVVLAEDDEMQEAEKRFKSLESTKKDVKLLATRSNPNNEYYFQVENQAGEAMNLPYHERKALVSAMALHEKGRAALKKEDYAMALVLFLAADEEYRECTSELLNSVDNYALLHLDIAWCYLCLRNPAQIPDADRRLKLCEESFHKTYGPNLERLMAIKGFTGNESALYMRLHLLQGVVLFHKNQRAEAKQLFERAQSELTGLKVDDNSICLLMELGFTNREACLGLRATRGNIEAAEELIQRKRKEKDLARERNRVELLNERERNQLGLCEDKKQMCEPSLVQQLVGMGFCRRISIKALKKCNNSVSDAIAMIQDTPHLLKSKSSSVSQEVIAQVASLGNMEPDQALEALEKCPQLEKAVKSLSAIGQLSGPTTSTGESSVASASASAMSILGGYLNKRKKRELEEQKALMRVSEDLIDNDLTEDHLDLNLTQEEQFLVEYLSLLTN